MNKLPYNEKQSRINDMIKTRNEIKTLRDLNINSDDYRFLLDAIIYIKNLPSEDILQKEIMYAFVGANFSYCEISGYDDIYDVIGCILIKRCEIAYFDVLVRVGYFDVSKNMLHAALVLNRNVASKIVDLANPETVTNFIREYIECEATEKRIIMCYFNTEKMKEAVKDGFIIFPEVKET
jgi:hypothetical protein